MKSYATVMSQVIALGAAVFLLAPAGRAEADWRSWHRSHRPRYGIEVVLPLGATPLTFGDGSYYYRRGRYYRHISRSYVLVPAPVGAVVPALPEAHRTIVIDGITYHEYDGVYYKGGPAGYTVVPVAQATPGPGGVPVATAGQTVPVTAPSTVVVNVPNKNGSYTPVTLQLASGGMYIGPQGEVYPNSPTAEQLRQMYGK